VEAEAIGLFDAQADKRMAGASRMYMAMIRQQEGELEEAEREAKLAIEQLAVSPPTQVYALAVLAGVHLAQGRAAEARAGAMRAKERYDALGGIEEGESLVRLVLASALEATGDRAGAREALGAAYVRLGARAEKLRDPVRRKSFLEQIPENARTVELAKEWGI
jgi:ATP/maltotriose-dependent transcriptional regulator MalT